jgi:hypothetical protein
MSVNFRRSIVSASGRGPIHAQHEVGRATGFTRLKLNISARRPPASGSEARHANVAAAGRCSPSSARGRAAASTCDLSGSGSSRAGKERPHEVCANRLPASRQFLTAVRFAPDSRTRQSFAPSTSALPVKFAPEDPRTCDARSNRRRSSSRARFAPARSPPTSRAGQVRTGEVRPAQVCAAQIHPVIGL